MILFSLRNSGILNFFFFFSSRRRHTRFDCDWRFRRVLFRSSSPTVFPVTSGQPVTYYLDFTSRGPAAAANVVLADLVPAQIGGVAWSCVSGCAGSGTGNTIS